VGPGLSVASQEVHNVLDLLGRDVLLQKLAVVVQHGGDGVLSQDLIADLGLHDGQLLGNVILGGQDDNNGECGMKGGRGLALAGETKGAERPITEIDTAVGD